MSVDSITKSGHGPALRPPASTLLDSNISLVSHSDSSRSTLDSLEMSTEDFAFADEITPTEASVLESFSMDLDESKKDDANKVTNGAETNVTSDANTKHKQKENIDTAAENGTNSCVDQKMSAKSKIPKSKTFDTCSSVFNSKTNKFQFQEDSSHRPTSGHGNHVFMTSQECMVVPGCSKLPRETIASRLRFEKQRSPDKSQSQGNMQLNLGEGFHRQCIPDGYKTPSQRKDLLLRDLKRQLREMKISCDEKDREISMYKQHVDEETSKLVQAKDEELTRLREELKHVKQSYDDISNFCEESITAASVLEQKATDLKNAMDDREKQHQKIYLEMYRKGQDSARFEREEELERLANSGGCTVTISELVKKLAWTELELAKWQTIRRQESYHDATRPETEAETILRFLKDSFFHYITDEKDSDHHLRAMVKIFKYTEPQMKKIRESKMIEVLDKKNKKKSKHR
ncbi:hypothetical protein ACF0H5_022673 [Mactra antiquata]